MPATLSWTLPSRFAGFHEGAGPVDSPAGHEAEWIADVQQAGAVHVEQALPGDRGGAGEGGEVVAVFVK